MKTGEGKRMARARSERISMFKAWWGEEMGDAGVGGDGVGAGDVGMGEGGVGASASRMANDGDPGRQPTVSISDGSEDGGSSDEGISNDSA